MNTPRSKKPKRAPEQTILGPSDPHPDGGYCNAITNPVFSQLLGEIASLWPHVEDVMIAVLGDLAGADRDAARKIFRSIVNQKARIDVMRALLERSRINRTKSGDYDAIIDEFKALNDERNKYVHGFWMTHKDSGRVFFDEISDAHLVMARREIKGPEMQRIIDRMENLIWRVYGLYSPGYLRFVKPL
ncbi:MAG: hypothetical protein KIT00_02875 [Rhodospirillales bacterium]|nr:hypothetical protein [Rhodospirillales bacterium]